MKYSLCALLSLTLTGAAFVVEAWTTPSLPRRGTALSQSTTTTTREETAPSSLTQEDAPSTTKNRRPLSRTGHDNEAWKNGYTTCNKEVPPTFVACPDLPKDFPAGTYYRNGHARFESDDGMRCKHMFDGDGMVSACTFYNNNDNNGGSILFRNRFVRTAGYRADQATGQMTAPGTFGTRVSGGFWANLGRTDFKNVANTHCLYANETLYALWEGGVAARAGSADAGNRHTRGHDARRTAGVAGTTDLCGALPLRSNARHLRGLWQRFGSRRRHHHAESL